MTPAELLKLIDEYGQHMLHIGALPGAAHAKPTGDEEKEANAVYAKIKQAVEQSDPGDGVAVGGDLSRAAIAAVPEIVAFLRKDAKTRKGNRAQDALSMAASVLEFAIESRRPPAEVLAKPLTHQVVAEYPDWFLSGPGREQAERTQCAHGYNLTDTCPGCDADDEAAGRPFV